MTQAEKSGHWERVWVESSEEEELEWQRDFVESQLFAFRADMDFPARCAALKQMHDYFPGDNEVPEEGCWVLVKHPPHTEYTVPPLSMWFATPWPFQRARQKKEQMVGTRRSAQFRRPEPHRVKIVTPRGDLGLFPHEYARIDDMTKYYEFINDGMKIRFFGTTEGVPEDKLFYLRSRGIGKAEAISMLLQEIKAHGVCWLEPSDEVANAFCRLEDIPDKERLATA